MVVSVPSYKLVKGRDSKEPGPGILLISDKFEMLCNRASKDRCMYWYYCKMRRLPCPAKAVLVKSKTEEGEYLLQSWSEETEHTHPGNKARQVANNIKQEMCNIVKVCTIHYIVKFSPNLIISEFENLTI